MYGHIVKPTKYFPPSFPSVWPKKTRELKSEVGGGKKLMATKAKNYGKSPGWKQNLRPASQKIDGDNKTSVQPASTKSQFVNKASTNLGQQHLHVRPPCF